MDQSGSKVAGLVKSSQCAVLSNPMSKTEQPVTQWQDHGHLRLTPAHHWKCMWVSELDHGTMGKGKLDCIASNANTHFPGDFALHSCWTGKCCFAFTLQWGYLAPSGLTMFFTFLIWPRHDGHKYQWPRIMGGLAPISYGIHQITWSQAP